MQYPGGKGQGLAKRIASILAQESFTRYIEPFCGMCSVAAALNHQGRVWLNDRNNYVVALWQALQGGWLPPDHISEAEYRTIRSDPAAHDPALVAFAGFGCSFGGKWWGGYARDSRGGGVNFARRARQSLLDRIKILGSAIFTAHDYATIHAGPGDLVYCDPPYQGTTRAYGTPDIDYLRFWQWCHDTARCGAAVYVSEGSASRPPSSADEVWRHSASRAMGLTAGRAGKVTEHKLYRIRP